VGRAGQKAHKQKAHKRRHRVRFPKVRGVCQKFFVFLFAEAAIMFAEEKQQKQNSGQHAMGHRNKSIQESVAMSYYPVGCRREGPSTHSKRWLFGKGRKPGVNKENKKTQRA
jgi:hypothetical protein